MGENVQAKKTRLDYFIRYYAVIYAAFHLYTAFFGSLQSLLQRPIHVGFGLILVLLLHIKKNPDKKLVQIIDCVLIIMSGITPIYMITNYTRIVRPNFLPTPIEYAIAIAFVIVIFVCTIRLIGWVIPGLVMVFLVYALTEPYFPGIWKHNGIKLTYLLDNLYFTDRGIFGTVTGISSTMIATFVIFGALLFATGGGQAFLDLAGCMVGKTYGGAAKLATVASGLFGTISGNAASNVASTGAFTIPLMKRLGYEPEFAAAVEASASSGGQIMPPVMGAGAFIMAEMLMMDYLDIAKSALIPSFLFYFGILLSVDLKGRKENLRGVPEDEIKTWKEVLAPRQSLPIFLPVGVLLFFFVCGYTAVTCAAYAIVVGVVFYVVTHLKTGKDIFRVMGDALEGGAKDMLSVMALIACAQILLNMISMTGVSVKFTNMVIALGGESIFLAGVFAMFATMVLGMGLPTVAAYLLGASVMAPALIRLGVAPLGAHFFIFYYSIFAGLTPPVCATVFIASALAKAKWVKTAMYALLISVGAFVIPFVYLTNPALLLIGTVPEIIRVAISSTFGILCLSVAGMGYLRGDAPWYLRVPLAVCGILLVMPSAMTDYIGYGIGIISLAVQIFVCGPRAKKLAAAKKNA